MNNLIEVLSGLGLLISIGVISYTVTNFRKLNGYIRKSKGLMLNDSKDFDAARVNISELSGKEKRVFFDNTEVTDVDFENTIHKSTGSVNSTMANTVFSEISSVLLAVRNGDFSKRVEAEAHGEIDVLKQDVNNSVEQLDTAISEMASVSGFLEQGKSARRVQGNYRGKLNELKNSINASMENHSQMVGKVQTFSQEVLLDNSNLISRVIPSATSLAVTASAQTQVALEPATDNARYLEQYGIFGTYEILRNPNYEALFEEETKAERKGYERVYLTQSGAVAVDTGIFTGRTPKDRCIVRDDCTRDTIWWADEGANDNKPIKPEIWNSLKQLVVDELCDKRLFVVDTYCGSRSDCQLKVRFVTEVAWQAHFVTNMFIRPNADELDEYEPDFVVMISSKTTNPEWMEQGLNSENFVAFNLTEGMQIIGGTWYGGEIKVGIFWVMNYLLPLKGVMPMKCSANIGEDGDVAIFFGLSGSGKTTLSTDPKRKLIGDDEHGWGDDGIFNLEGGSYAKTINLSQEAEPDVFNAIRRDALLENAAVDANGIIDYSDNSKTENARVSYPIYHIENVVKPFSRVGHAKKIVFLCADAFGVLPPVSKLTLKQIKYYFLSGFTAKLAGTERGFIEPTSTFSACFGAAFLSLHPMMYCEQLIKRVEAAGTEAYLVNTGWNGSGKRISIQDTRGIIDTILSGEIENAETKVIPYFNLQIPTSLTGIDSDILDPRNSWADASEWQREAETLADLFIYNFTQYTDTGQGHALVGAGPKKSSASS